MRCRANIGFGRRDCKNRPALFLAAPSGSATPALPVIPAQADSMIDVTPWIACRKRRAPSLADCPLRGCPDVGGPLHSGKSRRPFADDLGGRSPVRHVMLCCGLGLAVLLGPSTAAAQAGK